MRQAACRANDFHHLLERQVLVILSLQHPGSDLGQQSFTGHGRRGIDAHRQGIDEKPDQPFQFSATTPCNRAADNHFGLPGKTRQQCSPGSHQGHVQRHALALRQGTQTCGQLAIKSDRQAGTGKILLRRAWPVGWQGQQRWRAVQRLAPVGGLVLQAFTAHPALLPDRIVCVLNGQRGQRIGLAEAQGRVQRQQFAGQHAHRPAVGDDVVHGQQQDVTLVLQL